jgi:hemoglobin/transferrin/lactoferrin receptor protein
MNRIAVFLFLFLLGICAMGQELERFMLSAEDLVRNADSGKTQIKSASRNTKFLKDLPVTVYVVHRDEILENGYTTLVDVLKDVPGIKVSQPGSAVDGETFLMNGLYGNYYCKILINDIPISPSVVSGTPIAAQLPIRQAQRIEIITGPSSALYGSDAIAGVVNIITNESNRPAWAQADISVGSGGYYNMNVMIGGKVGKNKNVMSYDFYGNFNQLEDMLVKYDVENNYNPALYQEDYIDKPYYKGSLNEPEFGRLPEQSNLIGFGLKYRGIQAHFDHMARKTHSSIGQSTDRFAYYDPSNFWGESMERLNVSYSNTWGKVSSATQLSYIRYRMNNQSSFRVIDDFGDKGELYKYAASDDIYFDEIVNYSFNPNLEFSGGFSLQYSGNLPVTNDLSKPFDRDLYKPFSENVDVSDPLLGSFGYNPKVYNNMGAYLQFYYNYKKFYFLGGARWDQHSIFGSNLSPKIGVQYKVSDNLSFRANYGKGFRTPSLYYMYNSVAHVIGADSVQYEYVPNTNLEAEKFSAFEIGARFNHGELLETELVFMYHKIDENITSTIILLDQELYPHSNDILVSAFANDENSKGELYSLQLNMKLKNLVPSIKLNTDMFLTLSKGKEILPNNFGELEDYRNMPNWFLKLNFDFRLTRNWVVIFKNTVSDSWKKRFFPLPLEVMEQTGLPLTVDGYYTLDMVNRFSLNRNFHAYLIFNNITNTHYGGMDAYGYLFDLNYNPQYSRSFRLGFTFTLD